MAGTEASGRTPRAMVHKRILDEASEHPDASIHELADKIGGASTDLVERVLEEYGDPAAESTPSDGNDEIGKSPTPPDADAPSGEKDAPSAAELTEKQLETMRAIHEQPTATQKEIGDMLGVSAATVCNRLSDVPGFAWESRREFVEDVVEPAATDGNGEHVEYEPLIQLEDRVNEVEYKLAAIQSNGSSPMFEPEFAHKIVKACLRSELLSEDEELKLLRALFGETSPEAA